MTAEGTNGRGARRVARFGRALRRLHGRTSLRVKLVTTLLALVIVALAAMGFVGISLLRGQLLGGYITALQQDGTSQAISNCLQYSHCPSGLGVYVADSSDQLSTVSTGTDPYIPGGTSTAELSGTVISWLANNPGQATTVPATGGGKALAMGFTAPGETLILTTNVSGVFSTIRRLTGVDLIVSVVIVFVLAIVGFALVQTNLRPLVDIEETAEAIADGELDRRVPERDPRTEIGSLGHSLNTMLSQIEAAFHDREESEAAAHQSEERMRRFIADASHELRTPLTTIRGFAEYYRQRGGLVAHWDREEPDGTSGVERQHATALGLTPNDLDRIMQRLEKEAARMGLLVEDLLLLARLDQQRPLAQQPIDLLSLAADAVHDTRLMAPSRTITLSVQPGAAFLVTGDEARLRQVVGNLMSNALTHTPDGTPIEISIGSGPLDPRVADSGPAVFLDVIDHGPGMTPEQAHRVFERFYRADQARTRATGGSGLGLAIVNALVAAHGGLASVRTAPGRGATFRVALPLALEAQGGEPIDDDFGPVDDPDAYDGDGAGDRADGGAGARVGSGVGSGAGDASAAYDTDDGSVTYGTSVAAGDEPDDNAWDEDVRAEAPSAEAAGAGSAEAAGAGSAEAAGARSADAAEAWPADAAEAWSASRGRLRVWSQRCRGGGGPQ